MAEWSGSYVSGLPDSAFACVRGDDRFYPHHDSTGKLDLPHLRAALSRVGDASNEQCGKGHLQAHAEAQGMGKAREIKAQDMSTDELDAWFDGRIPRRLLAIPFGGPVPSAIFEKGVDLDDETFTARTDIKPRWLDFRVLDWHHGHDEHVARTPLGKADRLGSFDGQPEPDEDGWWVDAWLERGNRYLASIRRLIDRGGQIFGSSESVSGMVRKARSGEILAWPYWRQTLSPMPRNTYSSFRPIKAVLEDALTDYEPGQDFWSDVADELRTLGADLRPTSDPGPGNGAAKTGRVLSSINETDIEEALTALLGSAEKVRAVLARARKEELIT